MGWPKCDSTLENDLIHEKPVWHDLTFHDLGLWVSAVFGLIAIVVSFLLIFLHGTHYLRPGEQRHIIRILLMVPIYAAVSLLSYYNYTHSVYFEVVRDCYEAFAIASFFSLLCNYIAPDLHDQKNYFRTVRPRRWVWPMGWIQKCWGGEEGIWRTPRSGLTWFNVIWSGIFQYCFIRVFMTCVAVVTQALNRYCLESLNPAFSHVWVMGIEAVAVSIAMYCLIQFYVQVRKDIAQHKPLLKVAAIKLVIFLSFWQTLLISFLTSAGAIKANKKFQTPDIKVGIPSMLLCIEMAIFAVFHLWAFSYRPYVIHSKEYAAEFPQAQGPDPAYKGGFCGVKAYIDALNPWDMIKAVGRAGKWLFSGRKTRQNDSSYGVSTVRTNMDAFPQGPPGQNLSTLSSVTTAYGGSDEALSPKPKYPGSIGEENLKLLANAQVFGASRPDSMRPEGSPYRSDDVAAASPKNYPQEDWHGQDVISTPAPRYTGLAEPQETGLISSYPQEYGRGRSPAAANQQQQGGRDPTIPHFDPPPTEQKRGRRGR